MPPGPGNSACRGPDQKKDFLQAEGNVFTSETWIHIFKRKNEYIPAEIIDKCGLKGYNINDAYVSDLHAGFILNKGRKKE